MSISDDNNNNNNKTKSENSRGAQQRERFHSTKENIANAARKHQIKWAINHRNLLGSFIMRINILFLPNICDFGELPGLFSLFCSLANEISSKMNH